jgi:hypothetical protein
MMVLNIQFWRGDKDQAMALARLIADLEPVPRKDVMILFTARFDCEHDEKTIAYVSNKFDVARFTTKRNVVGWPAGPNNMMGESYSYCIEMQRFAGFKTVDSVMFIEADCIPLSKDWLNQLMAEFKASGKLVSGAWLKKGDAGCEHVNGNCIMSIDFWRNCKVILNPPKKGGWDAVLAYAILPYAHPSRLIWSDYRLGTDDNAWKGCDYLWQPKRYGEPSNALYGQDLQPVWLHGIKTMAGINCVREKLLNE